MSTQEEGLPTDDVYPFYELKFIMRVLDHEGKAPIEDWRTARGMAREIFKRWHPALSKGGSLNEDICNP